MDSGNLAPRLAGWLYIVGLVAGILSIASAVDAPNYLTAAAEHANQVMIPAFFHLLMAPAYVGIAILLYPVLRRHSPHMAFGFASFRIAAGVFIVIGVIVLIMILTLSQEFVGAGTPYTPYFETLGGLLRVGRDLVNHVATILAVSVASLFLFSMLYYARLIPRWLSV